MVYEWRHGARCTKLDAQAVGRRLEALEKRDGGVTADAVVKDARRSTSPMHEHFEWDDAAAAHQFRLEQARDLIASVVVTVAGSLEPKTVRAFVNVATGGGYESLENVLRVPDKRAALIARALREADEWRRRYAEYEELAGIVAAIEEAREHQAA